MHPCITALYTMKSSLDYGGANYKSEPPNDERQCMITQRVTLANLLASAAIVRHRPNAVIVQSESAEYMHHVSATPSHDVKLRNKLVFLSLDLLYSKSPDADVLMFVQENGMTRDEFMWFMHTAPAGYQI